VLSTRSGTPWRWAMAPAGMSATIRVGWTWSRCTGTGLRVNAASTRRDRHVHEAHPKAGLRGGSSGRGRTCRHTRVAHTTWSPSRTNWSGGGDRAHAARGGVPLPSFHGRELSAEHVDRGIEWRRRDSSPPRAPKPVKDLRHGVALRTVKWWSPRSRDSRRHALRIRDGPGHGFDGVEALHGTPSSPPSAAQTDRLSRIFLGD